MGFDDIWDDFVEGVGNFFSFEWASEMFSFEGMSNYGLGFGTFSVLVSYMTRYINLNGSGLGLIESMTQFMPPAQRIFWTIASYVGAFIGGYFIGNYYENT